MEVKKWLMERKAKIAFALATLAVPALGFAASADIDWTNITAVITGLADNLIPAMITLVTAAVPLLIILAVVSFVLMFLKRILDMLNIHM
jgi:hypothetical protein